MKKIIIAGNGIAGHSALQELLKSPEPADITVVWEEHPNTYMRTQIIRYAVGDISDEKFFMTRGDFYAEKGVRSIRGKITAIDRDTHTAELSTGETLDWDRLILATGACNFVPPVPVTGHPTLTSVDSRSIKSREGIYTIRDLEDARNFGRKLKRSRKALVVGGGLLGLEAADTLINQGLDVTVVEFAPRLLPRQMDTSSSALFQKQAEDFGLKFILGDSVRQVRYDGDTLAGVDLVSGSALDCDLILFSIGIRSNLETFGRSVAADRGIIINKYTETSEPDIFACGDVAEYNGLVYGTWGFAMASGKAAGLNAAGSRTEMKPYVLNTMFNALGIKAFSTGAVNFDDPTLKTHMCGDAGSGYVKLLFSGNELAAGVLMGDTSQGPKLSKAIDARMSFEESIRTFCQDDLLA